tara:strand:- start:505 stop:681 length:177 start_codon:yes stop_codon:yes gene_type:complete
MKYVVYMTDSRGKNKVKVVEAYDVKEAEGKAKTKYPSHTVGRISNNQTEIDMYSQLKK